MKDYKMNNSTSKNYFNLQKIAADNFADDNFDDFDDFDKVKPSVQYHGTIGVRVKVIPQDDKHLEVDLARRAIKEIREQISHGVNEDEFEAWLSGWDEEPTKIDI